MLDRFKSWMRTVKTDVIALYIAMKDSRTPLPAKLMAAGIVTYMLSPIDLIPDFIPVLGYADDLLIVGLGITIVVWLIPDDLMSEFRAQAVDHGRLPPSRVGAVIIIALWIGSLAALGWWFFVKKSGV